MKRNSRENYYELSNYTLVVLLGFYNTILHSIKYTIDNANIAFNNAVI